MREGVLKNYLALLLLLVPLLLVLKNRYERENAYAFSRTVESIYDDRLVAESYIYQYAEYFHKIIQVIDNDESTLVSRQIYIYRTLDKVRGLHTAYGETALTTDEAVKFKSLIYACAELERNCRENNLAETKERAHHALEILSSLSTIQVQEGKAALSSAEKIFDKAMLISDLETIVLLFATAIGLYRIFRISLSKKDTTAVQQNRSTVSV